MQADIPAWVVAPLLVLILAACGDTSRSKDLVEITSESEQDFHDFVFAINGHGMLADGRHGFQVNGRHQGQTVALEVVLGATWETASLGPELPGAFQGTVEFRSVGAESDQLLRVMDQIYATQLRPSGMRAVTFFTAITLAGDPRDPGRGIVKIKLFFEPADEDRYAELYTNIDLSAGKVYVNEKDPDYRKPVILALATSSVGD